MELTGRKISSIIADRTPTKRYSLETSVCRNCNGNIFLKTTFFRFIWEKSSQRRNTAGFRKVMWLQNYVRRLFSRVKYILTKPVKVTKFEEFVKMAIHSRVQQDSVLRSKRRKSLVDSPASSSLPSSGREKTKSKVSWFRDVYMYILNKLNLR